MDRWLPICVAHFSWKVRKELITRWFPKAHDKSISIAENRKSGDCGWIHAQSFIYCSLLTQHWVPCTASATIGYLAPLVRHWWLFEIILSTAANARGCVDNFLPWCGSPEHASEPSAGWKTITQNAYFVSQFPKCYVFIVCQTRDTFILYLRSLAISTLTYTYRIVFVRLAADTESPLFTLWTVCGANCRQTGFAKSIEKELVQWRFWKKLTDNED